MPEHLEFVVEILEASLGEFEDGIAVLDACSRVVFWNPAAESITGHLSADLIARLLPDNFCQKDVTHPAANNGSHGRFVAESEAPPERPIRVALRHKLGHSIPALMRRIPLRNGLCQQLGTLLRFHPAEEIDALPHGRTEANESGQDRIEQSQAEMEDRLDEAWQEWTTSLVPFGILWVTVDQTATLRKTHGQEASEAMLSIVLRTLLHGKRPSEIVGRWGSSEYLVVSHERTSEMLAAHAHHLAELARTADFRWWGDRIRLSVSIGAAQAGEAESLRSLLQRSQHRMQQSVSAGGDQVTEKSEIEAQIKKTGGAECSQS